MLTSLLTSVVDQSRRFAKLLVFAALVSTAAMAFYIEGHIKINTDINQLLSDSLPYRKLDKQLDAAFPQKTDNLVLVLDGDTAEHAERAAQALADKLQTMPDHFTSVSRPDALPFFRTNGLLFLSKKELATLLDQIAQSQPMMATIRSDPTLRGFFGTIGLMIQGAQMGAVDASQIAGPLKAVSDTIQSVVDGHDKPLDWQTMVPTAAPASAGPLTRKYILVKPVLDYGALEPGAEASDVVRQTVKDLGFDSAHGVTVRLTGDVALNDEEFASVANGAGLATGLSGLLVFVLLFMAMKTWRIVLPIALTLCVGLVCSTYFATIAVGSLNLISVAFAVMFIGIAVDFGIQFGVRYRDQHRSEPDHAAALVRTAKVIAVPLAMAAGSTALGFLSFIPTNYRGVSELGLIAGAGMIIAFILNITLLPALMTLTKPGPEQEEIGYKALKPLNDFLIRRRKTLLPAIGVLTLVALGLATMVKFDFDPLDLKDPKTESVSTMFDAMQDPNSDAYAAQDLTDSKEDAEALAAKLSAVPGVDHVMTLESFVPEDQEQKLAMIKDTLALLAPTLAMTAVPPPSDEENLQALKRVSSALSKANNKIPGSLTLSSNLDKLVAAYTPDLLKRAQDNIVGPIASKMSEMGATLDVHPVSIDDIPKELKRDWVTSDGKWLVEIFPKRDPSGNPRNLNNLTQFIDAVKAVAPNASGAPVSIRESGRTIVSAFVHAGIYGLLSIGVLALVMLRKIRDVALMLTPLLIAGVLTLATIAVVNLQLNFANIIALPLLLSLGVSYSVYFVSYWRTGREDMLQSSMARAILFSAGTVLVAFASLCFSSHPGTRGMGILLTIALLYSLLCTFLMLPVLLGKFRTDTSIERF